MTASIVSVIGGYLIYQSRYSSGPAVHHEKKHLEAPADEGLAGDKPDSKADVSEKLSEPVEKSKEPKERTADDKSQKPQEKSKDKK